MSIKTSSWSLLLPFSHFNVHYGPSMTSFSATTTTCIPVTFISDHIVGYHNSVWHNFNEIIWDAYQVDGVRGDTCHSRRVHDDTGIQVWPGLYERSAIWRGTKGEWGKGWGLVIIWISLCSMQRTLASKISLKSVQKRAKMYKRHLKVSLEKFMKR